MDRLSLIQNLIDKNNFSKYLEIGTFKGDTFLAIRCRHKAAVDPLFLIPRKKKIGWITKYPFNLWNQYFEMTSDDFFNLKRNWLKQGLEIVFIDGLHTFEASLKDVLNSIKYLKKGGVIVLHDCYPPNEMAAIPAASYEEVEKMNIKGWTGEWCGDVWKTVLYLREQFPEILSVTVIDSDYGLGMVRILSEGKFNPNLNKVLFNKINNLSYSDLSENPQEIIGLKPVDEFKC